MKPLSDFFRDVVFEQLERVAPLFRTRLGSLASTVKLIFARAVILHLSIEGKE